MAGERWPQREAKATLGGFELRRPAIPETVTAFRHRAATFAAEQGADPDLVSDIAVAVSEAVTNAVKHAGSAGTGGIELSASVEGSWLTLRIADRGTGFDTGSSDGLGLGLAIIAHLCHDLKIIQEGTGTQVVMRFVLTR
ncbi:MAG: ATP-binding protein [Solirubrobacterales bacterium]